MPFKKGYTPWNTGLTKADPRIRDMTDKAQATMVERGSGWKGYEGHSLEIRQQMSEKKNALYATGWEPICGRAKKYDYESPVAGKIKVDGTWELIVAKHLDSLTSSGRARGNPRNGETGRSVPSRRPEYARGE